MSDDNLIKDKEKTINGIDQKTGFVIGSPEYYAYYFPKKEERPVEEKHPDIDPKTGFIVGSDEYNEHYFPKNTVPQYEVEKVIDPTSGFIVGSKQYYDYYFNRDNGQKQM